MKALLFVFVFGACVSCLSKDVELKGATLLFSVDEKKITGSASGDNYSFRFKDGKAFTLSPIPNVKPEMMDSIIREATDEIKGDIKKKKTPNLRVKSYTVHSSTLGIFAGKEAAITTIRSSPNSDIKYVQCIYIFLLWDGKMCWKGAYSCAVKGEMGAVHNILKTGRRIK